MLNERNDLRSGNSQHNTISKADPISPYTLHLSTWSTCTGSEPARTTPYVVPSTGRQRSTSAPPHCHTCQISLHRDLISTSSLDESLRHSYDAQSPSMCRNRASSHTKIDFGQLVPCLLKAPSSRDSMTIDPRCIHPFRFQESDRRKLCYIRCKSIDFHEVRAGVGLGSSRSQLSLRVEVGPVMDYSSTGPWLLVKLLCRNDRGTSWSI